MGVLNAKLCCTVGICTSVPVDTQEQRRFTEGLRLASAPEVSLGSSCQSAAAAYVDDQLVAASALSDSGTAAKLKTHGRRES